MREALQMLAQEGLVTRSPRFGTRVTGRIRVLPLDEPAAALPAPDDSLGTASDFQELDLRLVPATPVLRARLGVEDDFVIVVEHLLLTLGSPTCVRVVYLPITCLSGDRLDTDLVQRLQAVYGRPSSSTEAMRLLFANEVAHIETTVEAVPCDPRTSRLLALAPGAPVLLCERLVQGSDGQTRELSFTHFPGDRIALLATSAGDLPH